MKIGIVTDSTSDLPLELARENGIEVVPLQVLLDNQQYRDGVDLLPDEFYQRLASTKTQPTTSQPAPGVFAECYSKLLTTCDAILSIHLTERLSGTVRSAALASQMFPEAKIKIIDSYSTSMGLGGIVLEAARAVGRGMNLEQVASMVQRVREQVRFVVSLDTLEYVSRGGRVSKLQAFLGSILQIKPLLQIVHGEVEFLAKVRTKREAIRVLVEQFKEQVSAETGSIISIMHTAAEEEALKLRTIIEEAFKNVEVVLGQAGPVLGAHTGPGALALIYCPKFT